jgi:G:T-mismatch repair DNA endonuclease (very short patch repair protein)
MDDSGINTPIAMMAECQNPTWAIGEQNPRNVTRNVEHLSSLEAVGRKPLVVWECETEDIPKLAAKISRFLGE